MALPDELNDRWYQAFTTDASGNPALRAVLAGSSRVLNVNTTPVSNVGALSDLMTYNVPANTLAVDGQFLRIVVEGTTAANANSKTVAVLFGGTAIGNIVGGALNNGTWGATVYIVRKTATTQEMFFLSQDTAGNNAVTRRNAGALTLSNANIFKLTGASGVAADNDVTQNVMLVEVVG